MNSNKFRKELLKIMPGYKWTVHRADEPDRYIDATGIQSAGFNRMSTLFVIRRDRGDGVEYEVKSSGFGKNAAWLAERTDGTLARALRGLQTHYKYMASEYSRHANDLELGRKPPTTEECATCQ